MTDQIPADKVRKLAARFRQQMEPHTPAAECEVWERAAEAVEALLPSRPTLADMTDQERDDAVGTWADVEGFHPYRAVIDGIPAPKVPVFRPTAGSLDWVYPEDVTPLPELGRAWSPGGSPTGTPAPAPALPEGWRLADHKDNGRVIVTNTTPAPYERVYYVLPSVEPLGFDWLFCEPDELTYLDGPEATAPVPPNTLTVGSVWDDVYALTQACHESGRNQIIVLASDGNAYVWSGVAEWWESGCPRGDSGPYTILHTGEGAVQ